MEGLTSHMLMGPVCTASANRSHRQSAEKPGQRDLGSALVRSPSALCAPKWGPRCPNTARYCQERLDTRNAGLSSRRSRLTGKL